MKSKARIERWVVLGNVIVGYLFDHKHFAKGTRVRTDAIVEMGITEVRCVDGDYKLGEPGTREEHNRPLIGG